MLQDFISYIISGFSHVIPYGFDHILFICSIYFLPTQFKNLIIQCSIFTLAHSITLFISYSKIISFNDSVVETLIAASILFTSVENLFLQRVTAFRYIIIFAFGLIHGCGFASAIRDLPVHHDNFLLQLFGFNLGVEIAQFTVILLLYFTLYRFTNNYLKYQQQIVYPMSTIIACISMYWFIDRLWGIQL